MKKTVHIITIQITDPEPGTISDTKKVISSLIDALRDGQCKDAYYTSEERYPSENYTMTIIDEEDDET